MFVSFKVDREKLLQTLESVEPGLASLELTEQANCFAFTRGRVYTYNDEVSVRAPSPFPEDFTGAVPAGKFLELLRKLTAEQISIEPNGKELYVKAPGGRKSGLRLEAEVRLPMDEVERPKSWVPLPEAFCEAVNVVAQCASRNTNNYVAMCVHVHPEFLEASDDWQVCRWPLATGVHKPAFVRAASVRPVAQLGATKVGETKGWLHFRNPAGVILSCRRFFDEYPDLSPAFKAKGVKVALPKGLADATDVAAIFSSEDPDRNHVLVDLRPGRVRVRGEGASGWYSEPRKVEYDGPPLSFWCPPQVLIDLVKRHNACTVSPEKLWVDAGAYQWMTCLSRPQEADDNEEGETDE